MPVEFSKDNVATLAADDADLTSAFTTAEISYVATDDDTTYVAQTGSSGYAVFNFEQVVTGSNAVIKWDGKSNLAPSDSPVKLQIYNRTSAVWQDLASEVSAAADTDFTISAVVSSLTDYQEVSTNVVACRVWQAASVPAVFIFPDVPIDITSVLSRISDWDVQPLSSKVPAGTKAVFLHFRNLSGSGDATDGVRTTGSSLVTSYTLHANHHSYKAVALDGSYQFSGIFTTDTYAEIIAYTSTDLLSINYVDVTLAPSSTFGDTNLSASLTAGDLAGLFHCDGVDGTWDFRLRGGSGDDPPNVGRPYNACFGLGPVDGTLHTDSRVSASGKLYLIGRLPDTAGGYVNPIASQTISTLGNWTPLACDIPDGSTGVFFQIATPSGQAQISFRKYGATGYTITANCLIPYTWGTVGFCGVPNDGSADAKKIEYYLQDTACTFIVIGYTK